MLAKKPISSSTSFLVRPAIGDADDDVLAPAVLRQQQLEGAQHHHVQRGALAAAQRLETVQQRRGKVERLPRAAVRLHRRPGPVRRQLQQRRRARQPLLPVADLAVEHLAPQLLALPHGEIRVLHRRLGSGGSARRARRPRTAPTARGSSTPVLQPSLTMWWMHSNRTCSSSRHPQQRGAEERALGQVERARRILPRAPPHLRLARRLVEPRQVLDRQREAGEGRDHLHRASVHLAEDGPQRLVAADDLAQRSAPARPRPACRAGAARRGGCTTRSRPPAGPGTRGAPARTRAGGDDHDRHGTTGGSTGSPARRISSTRSRQLRHRGALEERAERKRRRPARSEPAPGAASPAASARRARRSRRPRPRIPCAGPRPRSAPGSPPSACAARRDPRPSPAASGSGSARRSSLPFCVSGSRSSRTYADGTMYSGSSAFRCARSVGGFRASGVVRPGPSTRRDGGRPRPSRARSRRPP